MSHAYLSSMIKAYPSTRLVLAGTLVAACFACGAVAPADPPAVLDASGAGTGAALTVPIGQYTGCTMSTVNLAANLEATNGGNGTVTLSMDGEGGVSGALAFDQFNAGDPSAHVVVASGTIGFAPTSSTTAALNGGAFDIQTLDGNNVSTSVPVAASSLSLVGDTLFISVYGQSADTKFSGFCLCPVPASLPRATVVSRAPTTRSIPTGTYGGCTTSYVLLSDGERSTGGNLSLTLTSESDGTLTATQSAGFPMICGGGGLAFHDTAGSTATVSGGQTCLVQMPCGPPPSLVPSVAPSEATLTNLAGSIEVVGDALFINVAGDAPPQACGGHAISLICPTGP
jgi:hypothetical protein